MNPTNSTKHVKRITVVIDAAFGVDPADEFDEDDNAYASGHKHRNILEAIADDRVDFLDRPRTIIELGTGDVVKGTLVSIVAADPITPIGSDANKRPDLQLWDDPSGEWAALYVDGKLDSYGDRYNPLDRALELAGVKVHSDNDFLLGGNGNEVAKTVAEIEDYGRKRAARQELARAKREMAARLLREAERIEKGEGWT